MTWREIHKSFLGKLKNIYPGGEAAAITDIIFSHFAVISRQQIIMRGDEEATPGLVNQLDTAMEKLLRHIPVQYITGFAWFCDIKFAVNERVLIPRPETEELVKHAADFLKTNKGKKVLDIGTGSGCIPVSLKKIVQDAEILSVDISGEAVRIANENALINNTTVEFLEMNFLDEKSRDALGEFDVIISNPPYIPEEEKNLLDKNVVMHEPHLALFVPQQDPLIFYKKIQDFADDHLAENGRIFLEVHENFANGTAGLFPKEKYECTVEKDISGKERMVLISRCR
ncbi:MAG: peptide chain release factor N(5)-glutamine methyltransferase [Ferruginibacter sp.]